MKIISLGRKTAADLCLGLLLLLVLAALSAALGLDILVVDRERLVDLGFQSALVLDALEKVSA